MSVEDRCHAAALAEAIEEYDPDDNPLRCNNCANARVSRGEDRVMARCRRCHGKPRDLLALIRPWHPNGWRAVERCADFEPAEEIERC